jgi:DMSO/TMAO reductase YedYZ molybdopterin-dependent catalytic subunit
MGHRDDEGDVTTSIEPLLASRVVVTEQPENSEFPFAKLGSWLTPIAQFYVRNHFAVPELDPTDWRLQVGAAALSLDDLAALPQRSLVATLECAGNGRAFCSPPVPGVPWKTGAVSNGEWAGPSLASVLEAAGAPIDRPHVHLTGADRGELRGHVVPFARSLPRAKALDPDTLVALTLNGEPLSPAHGAPARALVPGWYGMASVKWLVEVEPAAEPSDNPFMTEEYTRAAASGRREPLAWTQPKAQIARPREGAVLDAGSVEIVGAAWTGEAPLERVDVSTDGGATWRRAELEGPCERWAWRLWRHAWDARPGDWTLLARATDAEGRTQPERPDPAAPGYMNHWMRPHPVTVAG